MANNRLYIRCRNCGQTLFLAKHFSDPWSLRCDLMDVQMFFNEHYACENEFDYGDETATDFNQFHLVTAYGYGYPKIKNYFITNDSRFFTKVSGGD